MAILTSLRDPRIKNVTVLGAEAAGDLRTAKVYISVMGEPKDAALCLHGLNSAKGFLQAKIADRLESRNTPVLQFVVDDGVKRSIETSRVLRETLGTSVEGETVGEVVKPATDGHEEE